MSTMTISEKSAVSENIDCYENLANAIVLQAVKDYKAALHTLEDYPESSHGFIPRMRSSINCRRERTRNPNGCRPAGPPTRWSVPC